MARTRKKKNPLEGWTSNLYMQDKDGNNILFMTIDLGTKEKKQFVSDEEMERYRKGINRNLNEAVNDILIADPENPIREFFYGRKRGHYQRIREQC